MPLPTSNAAKTKALSALPTQNWEGKRYTGLRRVGLIAAPLRYGQTGRPWQSAAWALGHLSTETPTVPRMHLPIASHHKMHYQRPRRVSTNRYRSCARFRNQAVRYRSASAVDVHASKFKFHEIIWLWRLSRLARGVLWIAHGHPT